MLPLVKQFLDRRLIPESEMTRFEAAVNSSFRLRNSVIAELLIIAIVYGVGVMVVWRQYIALNAATWYASPSAEGSQLSLAGCGTAMSASPSSSSCSFAGTFG